MAKIIIYVPDTLEEDLIIAVNIPSEVRQKVTVIINRTVKDEEE